MKRFTRTGCLALALVGMSQMSVADEPATFSYKSLTPEVAMELAQATLKACRDAGFQTAVAVVDRNGILQVLIRDQLAGPHTPETARRKAWTAASFKTDTLAMADLTQAGNAQSGIRFVSQAMMAGGGLPIEVDGAIAGGIGISGAPGGKLDHECGEKGLQAIEEKLMF
ncbi:MAG: heme-binding protein [Gammaproteobacteria bacterium]